MRMLLKSPAGTSAVVERHTAEDFSSVYHMSLLAAGDDTHVEAYAKSVADVVERFLAFAQLNLDPVPQFDVVVMNALGAMKQTLTKRNDASHEETIQ